LVLSGSYLVPKKEKGASEGSLIVSRGVGIWVPTSVDVGQGLHRAGYCDIGQIGFLLDLPLLASSF